MKKTVIEVLKPVMNENGDYLDINNEPMKMDLKGTSKVPQEQQFSQERYYLLHWGLETNIIYDAEKNPIPYTNTVGICQHMTTGYVETFLPGMIKVIGFEG